MAHFDNVRLSLGRHLPVVLQSESAECGLACLSMVAAFHGQHWDMPTLRRKFSLSLRGVDLVRVIEIAARLGLQGRPLRLELQDLHRLKMPCILHWDMNHFVALRVVQRDRITIHDPRYGEVRLTMKEASGHFTGVALELAPMANFEVRAPRPGVSLRQLTGQVAGLPRALWQVLTLSVSLQVFTLLGPFYLQWVVDQVLGTGDSRLLATLSIGFGLLVLFQVAIAALRNWSVTYLSTSLGVQWTSNVFGHLLRLPLDYFEKRDLGDVTSRMGSIQSIQRTLTTTFVESVIDGLMAIATLALMLMYSWQLAAVTLIAIGAYQLLRSIAFRPLRDNTERQMVTQAKQQGFMLESIRGVQSIKLGNRESVRRARFQNLMTETANQDLRLARLNLAFATSSQLVFGLERVAVIWIGTYLALQNVFSVGMLIAYLAYKEQFSQRIGSLIDKYIEFRMLRLHGERLADIALTAPEFDLHADDDQPLGADISIDVKGLGFRYAEGEPWVLRDCSFTIAAGESVAITGASGCGKTTLMKIMLGLLRAEEGSIEIGGRDLARMNPSTYRSAIGAVMQDDQLFAGSVAENICFGDVAPDQPKIEAAARLAAIHDEIAAMPMGYHSLIGDMGTTLSGGQKQRVILARALYREPRILFLDEATSHLDVERERLVNDAICRINVIKVIVAHRPETIASADRVLILEGGRTVGSHYPGAKRGPTAIVDIA
jgi:ATP-binding cassette, subfamily B, bacterial CvaB/MchF/RaxB